MVDSDISLSTPASSKPIDTTPTRPKSLVELAQQRCPHKRYRDLSFFGKLKADPPSKDISQTDISAIL